MKIFLICVALVGAALAMPVAETESAKPAAAPATPEVKTAELPQADTVPAAVAVAADKVSSSTTSNADAKPEVKSEVKPEVKPEAQAEIKKEEVKSDIAVEAKKEVTPEIKQETAPIEAGKSNVAPEIAVPNQESSSQLSDAVKTPEPQVKTAPVEEKLIPATAVEVKSENAPAPISKSVADVKREAIPDVKSEESASTPEKKPEEVKATVFEVPKSEAKSDPEKPVDVVKAANEMAGIADDLVDPAAFIPQPEKKIDLPVVPGKSDTPAINAEQLKKDSAVKTSEPTPAVASDSAIPQAPKSAVEASAPINDKVTPVESPKSAEQAPPSVVADIKPNTSEDSLRVVRDTVDDQKKALKKTEDKSAGKVEAESPPEKIEESPKPAEKTPEPKIAAPVEADIPKIEEPAKTNEPAKAAESDIPEKSAKAPESESPATSAPKPTKEPELPKPAESTKEENAPKVEEQQPQKPEEPASESADSSEKVSKGSSEESSSEEEKPAPVPKKTS